MKTVSEINNTEESPFDFFSRDQWDRLADRSPLPLTHTDLSRLASLGDPIDIAEVDAIYRPLTALLQLYVEGHRRVEHERSHFLTRSHQAPVPFIIGIGGSVAVGKSTVARLLRFLLSRWEKTPRVDLITTDGFLFPNAVLRSKGLLGRKGFPESYDRPALISFLSAVKSGMRNVQAPVYSHVVYDIVEGESVVVDCPDILIVEGLNVLQPPKWGPGVMPIAVSDFFDFSIYVDANAEHIQQWFVSSPCARPRSPARIPSSAPTLP